MTRNPAPGSTPDLATPRPAVMDFPTAWAFINQTEPEAHHERCSWRTTNGAFLCDCRVLWDEYERRSALDPTPSEGASE